MEAEVMVAMTDGLQPDAAVSVPKAAAQPMLPGAQETAPVVGRTEGVVAEGSPDTTRVDELTPLTVEADNLRRRKAEARRDVEDAEKSFEELSKRAQRDVEEAARVRKEWDELLQRDAEARYAVREECNQAVRECDEARQGVSSLRADLGNTVARRLEAESVSAELVMELAEVRGILQAESDEHDLLHATVEVVCDDLQVVQAEGTSSLMAHAADITVWVRQLEREALCSGITQAFAVARSHYAESIDLETMSLGFEPGYEASELDEIEKVVAPIVRNLADKVEEIVLPWRG
ncbi:uncharacterized protein [Miscanthus floridulus]|uniref:uncharacterized protein n=1 Tax=Miscanthus floridulus TaxID=154761 RepID=UPI0034589550